MKRGEKMSAKQRAAHAKRIKAAWRKRKTNGSQPTNGSNLDASETIEIAVRARVQKLVQAEVKRQLAEIG